MGAWDQREQGSLELADPLPLSARGTSRFQTEPLERDTG
jgi:hypothetical protein